MPELKGLSEDQILNVIHNGEFGPDVIHSDRNVAVIMTQDWCSQWASMKNWIYSLAEGQGLELYLFIYNKSRHFDEFLKLKENRWRNSQIPYIRYYTDGKLTAESNYVTEDDFMNLLKRS